MLATDEPPLSAGDTYKTPDWDTVVKPQYLSTKARLVGILGSAFAGEHRRRSAQDGDRHRRDRRGERQRAARVRRRRRQRRRRDRERHPARSRTACRSTSTRSASTTRATRSTRSRRSSITSRRCSSAPRSARTASTTSTRTPTASTTSIVQVRTGTPVCWKVVSKPNTTVPATDAPQLFRAKVKVYGDGVTQLDERDVFFLVPPAAVRRSDLLDQKYIRHCLQ